jgi:hypothetical protein
LQPPLSPITSEGEESPEIESFEERVAQFEVENPVQQWYGCGGEDDPSSSHPLPFDSPPLAYPQNNEDNEESREESEDNK